MVFREFSPQSLLGSILYFSITEDLRVLVADLGLARDTQRATYYRMHKSTPMPIAWMAIESLNYKMSERLFSTKTDVVSM